VIHASGDPTSGDHARNSAPPALSNGTDRGTTPHAAAATPHQACVTFLKWCLPELRLRWHGYRKVHRLVCKRLRKRMAELGISDLDGYRSWIAAHPDEWPRIGAMCRIPISRFYRDRDVFGALGATILPEIAMRKARSADRAVRCWSAGSAAGEEPYTVVLLWKFLLARDWPSLDLYVLATDADDAAIRRAKRACYGPGSLKDLPPAWREQAFRESEGLFCLNPEFQAPVDFQLQDIEERMPDGLFDVILCRNLVFTYFAEALQTKILAGIASRLAAGGVLVLGKHETLPPNTTGLAALSSRIPIYRRADSPRRV
jgi:chemotaxis protein methyltransferase CheR